MAVENEIMNSLQLGLTKSDLWTALCYSVSGTDVVVDLSDGCNFENIDSSPSVDFETEKGKLYENQSKFQGNLTVDLRCKIFDSIVPELLPNVDVGYLRQLNVDIAMFSVDATSNFHEVLDVLQYSLASLILNLEFKFPFVFSYYGRLLTKLNYKSLSGRIRKMGAPLNSEDHKSSEITSISTITLGKLEKAILTEFNTLNVLKECDMSAHRLKLCLEHNKGLVKDESKRSIKCKAYKVGIFKRSDWD